MSKWVVDEGDSCPKCGAPIEVLVGEDNKLDTDESLHFPGRKGVRSVIGKIYWTGVNQTGEIVTS